MKKVGIVTIIDYDNYGNRLQNYALSQIIDSMGYESTTIINYPPIPQKAKYGKIGIILNTKPLEILKIIYNKIIRYINKELVNKRKKNFLDFTNRHIVESKFIIDNNSSKIFLKNVNDKFDYFVVGSDQVWNPNFRRGNETDFLTFADYTKRISVSASFGVSALDKQWQDFYRQRLKKFKYISVRETAGSNIVFDLIGIKPPVLIDPTMMLSKEEWLHISQAHALKPSMPYILIYTLGGLTKEADDLLNKINKNNKYKIVVLSSLSDKDYYDAGPAEFIDFINDASLFITDSFHGVVFSIILETSFVVFDRKTSSVKETMNSRIDTILEMFNIKERSLEELNYSCVFDKIDSSYKEVIKKEKEKFIDFLENALNKNIKIGGNKDVQ